MPAKFSRYTVIITDEKEAYTYTKREQKCGHIITKVEWTQTYNERPSYTTTHKGTNMRPNTQKLFKCHNYQSLTDQELMNRHGFAALVSSQLAGELGT